MLSRALEQIDRRLSLTEERSVEVAALTARHNNVLEQLLAQRQPECIDAALTTLRATETRLTALLDMIEGNCVAGCVERQGGRAVRTSAVTNPPATTARPAFENDVRAWADELRRREGKARRAGVALPEKERLSLANWRAHGLRPLLGPLMEPERNDFHRSVSHDEPLVNSMHSERRHVRWTDEEAARVVVSVLAEKTGFTTDMIEMSQNLECDLAVDSIKRVEILSEVQHKFNYDSYDADALARAQTVGEMVSALIKQLEGRPCVGHALAPAPEHPESETQTTVPS